MSKDPFHFLAGSICVVIVSANDNLTAKAFECKADFPLYHIVRVKSIQEADKELLKNPCHICLDDLTISQNSNKFEFLQKYGRKIPVIVIAKNGSIEDGFAAGRYGAREVISINTAFYLHRLMDAMNALFIKTFLIPDLGKLEDKLAKHCADALFDQQPDSISCWAEISDIDATYLRRKWEQWTKTKPRESLFLVNLYRRAFEYYKLAPNEKKYYNERSSTLKRMQNHFRCNRSRMMQILFRAKKVDGGRQEALYFDNISLELAINDDKIQ